MASPLKDISRKWEWYLITIDLENERTTNIICIDQYWCDLIVIAVTEKLQI